MPFGERPRNDWHPIIVHALRCHGGEASLRTMYDWVETHFELTPQELRQHGSEKRKYRNDFRWAVKELEQDGIVSRSGRGKYKMTCRQ